MRAPTLVKISQLAKKSGVPAATIKHYVREGLLPKPPARSGRTLALYDLSLVSRIQTIKDLQRRHALSLRAIRRILDDDAHEGEAEATIRKTLATRKNKGEMRTRAELVAAGMPPEALDFFVALGVLTPRVVRGVERYEGDDLSLLRVLGASRRAGITPAMLPPTIVESYLRALRELVRTELELFREGVVPRAGRDIARVTEAATNLSEQLVVLMRRKLLLPTLRQMVEEEAARR